MKCRSGSSKANAPTMRYGLMPLVTTTPGILLVVAQKNLRADISWEQRRSLRINESRFQIKRPHSLIKIVKKKDPSIICLSLWGSMQTPVLVSSCSPKFAYYKVTNCTHARKACLCTVCRSMYCIPHLWCCFCDSCSVKYKQRSSSPCFFLLPSYFLVHMCGSCLRRALCPWWIKNWGWHFILDLGSSTWAQTNLTERKIMWNSC